MKNDPGTTPEASEPLVGKNERDQQALMGIFIKTVEHYFGSFRGIFKGMNDPRVKKKTTYSLTSLCFAGVLMFLFRLGSRRQITYQLRQNEPSAKKFEVLFNVETFPHGDTLNDLFSVLRVEQAQEAVTAMTEGLVRKKVLYGFRLRGVYYVVVIDGTGTLTFKERHCPFCLTQTHGSKTIYYHKVLEAKLVTPHGFAFSLMTEFIENPGENPTKQDCELKAFYRLAARLKERFPRLPLCLSLDSLFAVGPVFKLCEDYDWKYLIVHKDNLSSVEARFQALLALGSGNELMWHTGRGSEIHQEYRWVNDITYIDTEKRKHTLSVLQCMETKPVEKGELKTTRFQWVTNFTVSSAHVIEIANHGGRNRWKIENEGFNVQKNGGFALEHTYSNDETAGKIFYLLLQIAYTLFQLIERGSLFRRAFPQGVGSAKNIAFRLLEAWRNFKLTREQVEKIRAEKFQIRFDTS